MKATKMLGKAAGVLVKPVRVLMKSRDRARERDQSVLVKGIRVL